MVLKDIGPTPQTLVDLQKARSADRKDRRDRAWEKEDLLGTIANNLLEGHMKDYYTQAQEDQRQAGRLESATLKERFAIEKEQRDEDLAARNTKRTARATHRQGAVKALAEMEGVTKSTNDKLIEILTKFGVKTAHARGMDSAALGQLRKAKADRATQRNAKLQEMRLQAESIAKEKGANSPAYNNFVKKVLTQQNQWEVQGRIEDQLDQFISVSGSYAGLDPAVKKRLEAPGGLLDRYKQSRLDELRGAYKMHHTLFNMWATGVNDMTLGDDMEAEWKALEGMDGYNPSSSPAPNVNTNLLGTGGRVTSRGLPGSKASARDASARHSARAVKQTDEEKNTEDAARATQVADEVSRAAHHVDKFFRATGDTDLDWAVEDGKYDFTKVSKSVYGILIGTETEDDAARTKLGLSSPNPAPFRKTATGRKVDYEAAITKELGRLRDVQKDNTSMVKVLLGIGEQTLANNIVNRLIKNEDQYNTFAADPASARNSKIVAAHITSMLDGKESLNHGYYTDNSSPGYDAEYVKILTQLRKQQRVPKPIPSNKTNDQIARRAQEQGFTVEKTDKGMWRFVPEDITASQVLARKYMDILFDTDTLLGIAKTSNKQYRFPTEVRTLKGAFKRYPNTNPSNPADMARNLRLVAFSAINSVPDGKDALAVVGLGLYDTTGANPDLPNNPRNTRQMFSTLVQDLMALDEIQVHYDELLRSTVTEGGTTYITDDAFEAYENAVEAAMRRHLAADTTLTLFGQLYEGVAGVGNRPGRWD